MEWVALGLLAVAVIVVTALLATGRLDPQLLGPATSTLPALDFPDHPTSADVDPVRLGTVAYGYAPAEVDVALAWRRDRLAEQERALAERAFPERGDRVHPDA